MRFCGLYEEAIKKYTTLIKRYPGFYFTYKDIGTAYLSMGKWRQALSSYQRYLSMVPKGLISDARVLISQVYFTQRNFSLAKYEIDQIMEKDSKCLRKHWMSGLIALEEKNDIDSAQEALKIIEINLKNPNMLDDIAYYYHLKGLILLHNYEITPGIAALRKAVELAQWHSCYFQKELVAGLIKAWMIDKSIHEGLKLLSLNENNGELKYLLGVAYQINEDHDNAEKFFKQSQFIWKNGDRDFLYLVKLQRKLKELM